MQRLHIAIENALIAWAQAVHSDVTPIWADQDGRRPHSPFMVLDMSSPGRCPSEHQKSATRKLDTYTYGIRMQATLNIQVTADDALVRAAKLVTALELPSYMLILQTAGIATHGAQGLRDITAFWTRATKGGRPWTSSYRGRSQPKMHRERSGGFISPET